MLQNAAREQQQELDKMERWGGGLGAETRARLEAEADHAGAMIEIARLQSEVARLTAQVDAVNRVLRCALCTC